MVSTFKILEAFARIHIAMSLKMVALRLLHTPLQKSVMKNVSPDNV